MSKGFNSSNAAILVVCFVGLWVQASCSQDTCNVTANCPCFSQPFCCCGYDGFCYTDAHNNSEKCLLSYECNSNDDCPQEPSTMVCEYGVCDKVHHMNLVPFLIFLGLILLGLIVCCVIFSQFKPNPEESEVHLAHQPTKAS